MFKKSSTAITVIKLNYWYAQVRKIRRADGLIYTGSVVVVPVAETYQTQVRLSAI